MARAQSIDLRAQLASLLPPDFIWRVAQESEFILRKRKLNPVAFLWSLALGFAHGDKRTLAGLRRAYETSARHTISSASFYAHFNHGLVRFLTLILFYLLTRLAKEKSTLAYELAAFKDVIAIDSTIIRLHKVLKTSFPGSRTNHSPAAAKLHVVMSVKGFGPHTVKLSSARTHDGEALSIGKWVQGRLLLFDLGYYNFRLFDRIARNEGYFLSRVKSGANPIIKAVYRTRGGQPKPLIGKRLKEILPLLQGDILDVEVELELRPRGHLGESRQGHLRCRLVGLKDEDTGEYHLYFTNLPFDQIPASSIRAIYRARWTVELLFKSLKTDFTLDDIPSRKEHIVQALIYSTIVTWIVSNVLLTSIRARLGSASRRATATRWTRVLRSHATQILLIAIWPKSKVQELARAVARTLLREALDPNKNRPPLIEVAEGGPALFVA